MEKGSGIIIYNKQGKILLQLRDNKPKKGYANCWNIIGGGHELNETPESALKRELKEELGLEIDDFNFFKRFFYKDLYEQYLFYTNLDIDISNIVLNEGKELRYFDKDEINKLDLAFNTKEIINEFINTNKALL